MEGFRRKFLREDRFALSESGKAVARERVFEHDKGASVETAEKLWEEACVGEAVADNATEPGKGRPTSTGMRLNGNRVIDNSFQRKTMHKGCHVKNVIGILKRVPSVPPLSLGAKGKLPTRGRRRGPFLPELSEKPRLFRAGRMSRDLYCKNL